MIRTVTLGLAALLLVGAGSTTTTERNRKIASDFARVFYAEKDVRKAFMTFVSPDYIQHNPGIADGRNTAFAALEAMFSRAGARFDVKRIIVDGDNAVIHLHGRGDLDTTGARPRSPLCSKRWRGSACHAG